MIQLFRHKASVTVYLFFAVTLVIGLLNYRSYGISWDEPMQREMGNLCYDYITGRSYEFFNIQNKYHNATWEFINVLPERLLGLESMSDIYHSRHLLNFLTYWIGLIFFFMLARELLGSTSWALMAVVILFLTPRIFAHSFYNSKDLPFLSFFIMAIYAGIRFIKKPSWKTLAAFAMLSGFVFGLRILGILLPFLIGSFFLLNLFTRNIPLSSLKYLAGYAVLYPLCVYAFLPVLWPDPLYHLKEAFLMHSHFPYDDKVLFMGEYLNPQHLPWYYVPVWMAITIPALWQVFFALGFMAIPAWLVYQHYNFLRQHWGILLCIVWFMIPWLMVVLLNSHIYDEWRHLFFIYPAFVLTGVFGAKLIYSLLRIYTGPRPRFILSILLFGLFTWQCLTTGIFMLRNNPHQYVYFNLLAGKRSTIYKRYEMDYWGLAYKQSWQYFFAHLPKEGAKVQWQNNPGEFNLLWFDEQTRGRIEPVDYLSCEYFLTNYRWNPEYGYPGKFYSLKVDGIEINTIYTNH